MVTAYDYPSARVAEEAGVDIVLVGDSAAMTVLGYDTHRPRVRSTSCSMLAAAVRRGLRTPLLVGDLPFGSYEASDEQAIATAQRFVKEAGCDAVKLEGGGDLRPARPRDRRRRHPGDGPRRPDAADRDRARRLQGPGPHRRARARRDRLGDALALQEAGCFSIVFEAIPAAVTEELMRAHGDPGDRHRRRAGDRRPGARLPRPARHPRRPRRRGSSSATRDVRTRWSTASRAYADDVRSRRFPAPEHTYSIDPEELEDFREQTARATTTRSTT